MSGLNKRHDKKPVSNKSAFRPKGDAVDELLAMDDATRAAIMKDLHRNRPPAPQTSGTSNSSAQHGGGSATASNNLPPAKTPEDIGTAELTTVMIERLNAMERKCDMQRKEMSELNMNLISATDHLAEEKRRRVKAENELDAAIDELAQVHAFLQDYGLKWVGGTAPPESRDVSPEGAAAVKPAVKEKFDLYSGNFAAPTTAGNQTDIDPEGGTATPPSEGPQQQKAPRKEPSGSSSANQQPQHGPITSGGRQLGGGGPRVTPPAEPLNPVGAENNKRPSIPAAGGGGIVSGVTASTLPFDLNVLKKNAMKLSEMVGFSGVANDAQRAIIKERDVVHVVVYSDGICVKNGPFRPYGWALCDAFLNDLLDGYFPYEYKDKYPEGYPIEIVDKSKENCPKGFTNEGRKLGGGAGEKGAVTVGSHNDHGYKPLTKEDILKKLPERYVTKSGQLINVREGVSNFVGGTAVGGGSSTTTTAGGAPNFNTTVHGGTSAKSEQVPVDEGSEKTKTEYPEATATVQVRMPQGQRVVLHMKKENSVAQLREELLKVAKSFFQPSHGFDLCTVLPRRSLTDFGETLEKAGLAGARSAVFVQIKKAPE